MFSPINRRYAGNLQFSLSWKEWQSHWSLDRGASLAHWGSNLQVELIVNRKSLITAELST